MHPFPSARPLLQWLLLGGLVGLVSGIASALFLYLLELATHVRERHTVLVFLLPVAGLVLGAFYDRWGKPIRGGNNLVIDSVHEGDTRIPLRMAPMVLVGTVLTHLFGGSAGREGTAVQMGGSLAEAVAHRFRVQPLTRRELLAAGIAGGFGSVFGTPIAGTVFGLEVVVVGRLGYEALLPSLVAAVVGDLVTRGLGLEHTLYPTPTPLPLTVPLLGKWLVFAGAVALVAVTFVEGVHWLKRTGERLVPRLPLRMALGGLLVVALWRWVGTDAYLGLGLPTILRAFTDPELPASTFVLKLLFTALTLSAGFLGGEVTPLFFIGAALGNVLARLLGLPVDLGAAVGLAALFAASANTPLALSIMAVELLGANVLPHVAIVATLAYLLTGHRGIYPSQRIARLKHGGPLLRRLVPLRELPLPGSPPSVLEPAPMDDARRERIIELCAEGERLAKQRELASALLRFREAMALIPRPVEEHDLSLQVLTALGDICFKLGRFSEGKYALQGAVRNTGGLGQPLIHLRLGQCELELGNLERAADELGRAYKGGGEELFASEDPKYLEFVRAPHQR